MRTRSIGTRVGRLLCALLSVVSQEAVVMRADEAPPARRPAGADQGTSQERGDYRIGPEDVLDIAVWNNASVSRTVPVRPDGMISLPLLNDVQASGLTPMGLRDLLTRKLSEFMTAPEVAVIVKEVHSCTVTVVGEVRKPGRYEIRTHASVLDAIALAGGFTEFASRSRLRVLRPEGGSVKLKTIRYKDIISGEGDDLPTALKPGDTVVVP